jgi:hypothetical protein
MLADGPSEEDGLLIVVGKPEKREHLREAEDFYKALEPRFPRENTLVLYGPSTKNFDWSFAPAKEVKDAEELSSMSKKHFKLSKGDRIAIYTDHGYSDRTGANSGILMPGEGYDWEQLERDQERSPVFTGFTKNIAATCFAGHLHAISWRLPRTCSLTASTWDKFSGRNLFSSAIAKELSKTLREGAAKNRSEYDLDSDGKTNLMELLLKVLDSDGANFPLQQTSSMAYVSWRRHYIEKRGTYSIDPHHDLWAHLDSTSSNPEKNFFKDFFGTRRTTPISQSIFASLLPR